MGAFLMQSQLQQSSYSSALFLTSGAQNLLCLNLAAELGEPCIAAVAAADCSFMLVGIRWCVWVFSVDTVSSRAG
jgi:hypothetical protein